MAVHITGLGRAQQLIDRLSKLRSGVTFVDHSVMDGLRPHCLPHQECFAGNQIPRVKLILVDEAWDMRHDVMPKDAVFATENCKDINDARMASREYTSPTKNVEPLYPDGSEKPLSNKLQHGTAGAGVFRLGVEAHNKIEARLGADGETGECAKLEQAVWNLAPHVDLILLPIRRENRLDNDELIKLVRRLVTGNGTCRAAVQDFILNNAILEIWRETADEFGNEDRDALKDEVADVIQEQIVSGSIPCPNFGDGPMIDRTQIRDSEMAAVLANRIESVLLFVRALFERASWELGIVEALRHVIALAADSKVGQGDVVAIPLTYRDSIVEFFDLNKTDIINPNSDDEEEQEVDEVDDLPIIVWHEVERLITRLTCEHRISVVLSAGNQGVQLEATQHQTVQAFIDEKTDDADIFNCRGVACGAVLVGKQHPGIARIWPHKTPEREERALGNLSPPKRANFGTCVDAYGRGGTREIDQFLDKRVNVVDDSIYAHWEGTSFAAMVTAACLATVQQVRITCDFLVRKANDETAEDWPVISPYKPYEARAHIRQWQSLDVREFPCLEDMLGPPVNVLDWLRGSKIQLFGRDVLDYLDD